MWNITRIAIYLSVYLSVYISISFCIIANQKIDFFFSLHNARCINPTIKQHHKHSQVFRFEEAVELHLSLKLPFPVASLINVFITCLRS